MSRNIAIGIAASVLLHVGFFFGGQLLKAHPAPKTNKQETPTVELLALPPVEPDKPEDVPNPEESHDIADLVPPMQADLPSISESPFTQLTQPPPPPQGKLGSGFSIPKGRPGSGQGKMFDFASLDQKPEPRFQPLPTYPFEMKRAGGIEGSVTVTFVVDSTGATSDPAIIRSTNRGFESSAIEAVLKWKFRPGKKGGVAVNTRNVVITLNFTLPKD